MQNKGFQGFALLLAASTALGLSACNKAGVTCGSEDAHAVVVDIVKGEVRKRAAESGEDKENGAKLSLSKIRAAVEQLRITLADVRTTREDPNSSKRFCSATLRVVLPASLIEEADRAREVAEMPSISSTADNLNIEHSADTFEVDVEYEVQPTDDGDRLFAEVEGLESFSAFLGESVAWAMSRTRLEDGQREAQALEATQAAAMSVARAEGQKLSLESAQAESALANQSINALWRDLGSATRKELLEAQRSWGRKKDADCRLEGAAASVVPAEAEASRLNCDARITRDRYAYLSQFRGAQSEEAPQSRPVATEYLPPEDDL
jgi:hypothetical protein